MTSTSMCASPVSCFARTARSSASPPADARGAARSRPSQVAAVRLKKKGSHGGQNGMRSIISCLGNNQARA